MTFFRPALNSGIQRVVRNIMAHANTPTPDYHQQYIPVMFKNNSVYEITNLVAGSTEILVSKTQGKIEDRAGKGDLSERCRPVSFRVDVRFPGPLER